MTADTAVWLASAPVADDGVMLRVIAILAVTALLVLATLLGLAALRQERNAARLRERFQMRAELATWQRWRAATAAIDSSLHQLVLLGDEAVRRQTAAPQREVATEQTSIEVDDLKPASRPGVRRLSATYRLTGLPRPDGAPVARRRFRCSRNRPGPQLCSTSHRFGEPVGPRLPPAGRSACSHRCRPGPPRPPPRTRGARP